MSHRAFCDGAYLAPEIRAISRSWSAKARTTPAASEVATFDASLQNELQQLLRELSKDLIKISTEVNPLAVDRYFNFMLAYAKLYLLFGACVCDQGKLVVAAYGHAHRLAGRGEPRERSEATAALAEVALSERI